MTTYRTGNAIGSADPRDLYDNAENLDEFVNSPDKLTHPDRLGVQRKTWHGIGEDFQAFLQSSGYQDLGDYASGIEITARNQVIRADGELWRLSASEDLPYTTTGVGMPEGGAFVAVGDAVLRQELANPDKGAAIIGYSDASANNSGLALAVHETRRSLLPRFHHAGSVMNAYSSAYSSRFDRLRARSPVGRAYIWKNPALMSGDNYRFSLGVNMSGFRSAEWEFIADVDNLYRMRYGRVGPIRQPTLAVNPTSLSQEPLRVGDNAYFSSSSGLNASFTIEFTGTGLISNHYIDDRGGRFRVEINGGPPKFISTHSDNPENSDAVAASISKVIATDLPLGEHVAVFTFVGDDPNYAPVGGVSRGWFKYENGSPPEAYTAYIITGDEMGIAPTGTRITSNGVLDFAVSGSPVGSGFPGSFVPAHGSAAGALRINSRKMYVNEREVDDLLSDISGEVEIREFTLIQNYTAFNSNDAPQAYPMWEGELVTKFDRERGLQYDHTLRFLTDTVVHEGYLAMCSGRRTAGLTSVELDNGVMIDISQPTPAQQIVHDCGVAQSVVWGGDSSALALAVPYVEASAGMTKSSAAANTVFITERTDDFVKCYFRMCEPGATIPAGTEFTSRHDVWLSAL